MKRIFLVAAVSAGLAHLASDAIGREGEGKTAPHPDADPPFRQAALDLEG